MDALKAQFKKQYQGPDKIAALHNLLEDFHMNKDNKEGFQPAHLWPHCNKNGDILCKSLKPAWCFWDNCVIMSAAPTLAPFATTQTSQLGNNGISKHGHKS